MDCQEMYGLDRVTEIKRKTGEAIPVRFLRLTWPGAADNYIINGGSKRRDRLLDLVNKTR